MSMARNEMLVPIAIGLVLFIFCAILIGFGEFFGEPWATVAQAVAKYIIVLTSIGIGLYILADIAGRR